MNSVSGLFRASFGVRQVLIFKQRVYNESLMRIKLRSCSRETGERVSRLEKDLKMRSGRFYLVDWKMWSRNWLSRSTEWIEPSTNDRLSCAISELENKLQHFSSNCKISKWSWQMWTEKYFPENVSAWARLSPSRGVPSFWPSCASSGRSRTDAARATTSVNTEWRGKTPN